MIGRLKYLRNWQDLRNLEKKSRFSNTFKILRPGMSILLWIKISFTILKVHISWNISENKSKWVHILIDFIFRKFKMWIWLEIWGCSQMEIIIRDLPTMGTPCKDTEIERTNGEREREKMTICIQPWAVNEGRKGESQKLHEET